MDVFDLYFASVASMQFHPGAGRNGSRVLTLEECAAVAARMVEIRKSYFSLPSSEGDEIRR